MTQTYTYNQIIELHEMLIASCDEVQSIINEIDHSEITPIRATKAVNQVIDNITNFQP